MPLELGVWRIDSGLEPLQFTSLDYESRLQDLLDADITIASPDWMVVGREVSTNWGQRIDILAIDGGGNLVVIELKKNRTPRDIVAQVLEYGAWVQNLRADDIARVFNDYVERHHPDWGDVSIDAKFRERFNVAEIPDEMNQFHQLVIVSASLDQSTERIVEYLAGTHNVNINVIFFRVFKDAEREYLSRVWLINPTMPEDESAGQPLALRRGWNGEYYASFGEDSHRRWADAVRFGFISAGGGNWYTDTLGTLEPGNRVWVNVPGKGYVGVGVVTRGMARFDSFEMVSGEDEMVPLTRVASELEAPGMLDEQHGEHLVGVRWIKTVETDHAIKEKGFFGNQNTVARPKAASWDYTIQRLKRHFEITD